MTTNIDEARRSLYDALDEIERLRARVAELESQRKPEPVRKGRFIPKLDLLYWYVDSFAMVCDVINTNHEIDLSRIEIGNCYETREEAERAVKAQKVRVRLRDLAEGFKPDWSDESQKKWYVYYDNETKKYGVLRSIDWEELDAVYFESQEKALAAIAELGSDLDLLREYL